MEYCVQHDDLNSVAFFTLCPGAHLSAAENENTWLHSYHCSVEGSNNVNTQNLFTAFGYHETLDPGSMPDSNDGGGEEQNLCTMGRIFHVHDL